MIPKACKRLLAEVDFPIAEASTHAAREKSIRHGHPSTLPTTRDYQAVWMVQQRLNAILNEWKRGGKQGLCPVPDEPLPPVGTLGFRVQRYGMLQ